MKRKTLIVLGLLLTLSLLFVAQANNRVSAVHGPVTSPITGPVTGPVTGPTSVFKITGNIRYHLLGMLRRGAARFIPAGGVNIVATQLFNSNVSVSTTTDANGNYTLTPTQAGLYRINVSGGDTNFYAPPIRVVPLNKSGEKKADFQGLIFKF